MATPADDRILGSTWLTMNRYICEISPPGKRGPLTAGPQLLNTFGLMIGFFTCYGTSNMDSSFAWRIPFIILTSLAMVFVIISTFWLVESPRWLVLRGRHSEVDAAWDVLGVDHAEREKAEIEVTEEVVRTHSFGGSIHSPRQQSASFTDAPDMTTKHSFFDVFAPDVRLRTGLAVFLLGMQQLSGIDGVLYVSLSNSLPIKNFPRTLLTISSTHLFFSNRPVSPLRVLRSSLLGFPQSSFSP